MPCLEENQTEATLQEWRVAEGDVVTSGQTLGLVVTAKSSVEVHAPAEGVVRRLFAAAKSQLPVGFILCIGGLAEENVSDSFATHNEKVLTDHRAVLMGVGETNSPPTDAPKSLMSSGAGGGMPVRATPAARRLAKELNVSLEHVRAAFPGSEPISEKQVREFSEQANR